jgi:hypothetical protein
MAQVTRGTSFLLAGWVAAIALFVGVMLGMVPVYESSRRRHYMLQEVMSHEPDPAPRDASWNERHDDPTPEDRTA